MNTFFQDLRYGVRMLAKQPVFTIVAVLTLALGIGANTAIFSVVNAVLLRPLPLPDSDRVVQLWETFLPAGWGTVSVPNLKDWQEQNDVFEQLTAYQHGSFNLQSKESPERISGTFVTANFFDTLGTKPRMGRSFIEGEDQAGRSSVVILSDALWRSNFAADPEIINRKISVNGEQVTVIGVMPPEFRLPSRRTEIWVPLVFSLQAQASRGSHSYFTLGRLKEGVSEEQAREQMGVIAQRLEQQYPDTNTGRGVRLIMLHEQMTQNIRPALMVLLGAVGFVLLIACTNVTNLLLARAASRQKEVAIRVALGAGTSRLIRQFIGEGLLLSAVGGALGLALAQGGIDLVKYLGDTVMPRTHEINLDSRVLIFTVAVSILTGVIFGVIPAFQAARTNVQGWLKEGSKGTSAGAGRAWVRNALVVAEVASAFVLLIGAGLMIQSFVRLQQVEPGLNPESVLTLGVTLPNERYPEVNKITGFYDRLLERVSALPGVESAAMINLLPFQSWGFNGDIQVEGRDPFPPGQGPIPEFRIISPDYFESLRIPLIKGRYPSSQDRNLNAPVIVINQALAQTLWPDGDAVGKRIKFSRPEWSTIIGVVGDVRQAGYNASPRPELYYLYTEAPWATWMQGMTLTIRTRTEPQSLVSAIRNEVRAIDPEQPIYNVQTMGSVLEQSVSGERLNTLLLGSFAAVSLILALIGIYGVMSYTVTQNTREIGIRVALGAQRRDVLKLVLGRGMVLTSVGVGIGLIASVALTRFLSSLLFEVSATDPLTFSLITVLLAIVALAACYIPARRAMKVDPMVALRYE
jgi:putative ABC transport system permease protein